MAASGSSFCCPSSTDRGATVSTRTRGPNSVGSNHGPSGGANPQSAARRFVVITGQRLYTVGVVFTLAFDHARTN